MLYNAATRAGSAALLHAASDLAGGRGRETCPYGRSQLSSFTDGQLPIVTYPMLGGAHRCVPTVHRLVGLGRLPVHSSRSAGMTAAGPRSTPGDISSRHAVVPAAAAASTAAAQAAAAAASQQQEQPQQQQPSQQQHQQQVQDARQPALQQQQQQQRTRPTQGELVERCMLRSLAPLIDIGANLVDRSFNKDRAAVLERASRAGVAACIVTGTCVRTVRAAAELCGSEAGQRHGLWFTAGVHPHNAKVPAAAGRPHAVLHWPPCMCPSTMFCPGTAPA